MRTDSFDFHLPEDLIAQEPLKDRDSCRLMVLSRSGNIEHRTFRDIHEYLDNGDVIILNNTKVFPARLTGLKPGGSPLDILLVNKRSETEWEIMSKGGYTGLLSLPDNVTIEVTKGNTALFPPGTDPKALAWKHGNMPLPPYIKRIATKDDRSWYQTVYAEKEGSIAAPTAGLHFTDRTIEQISLTGAKVRHITLHVGAGTFRPIRSDKLEDHKMDSENYEMNSDLIGEIRDAIKKGNKVIAVGTTTTRALEGYSYNSGSTSENNGTISGRSDIFIYPGYSFKMINGILTNFHLPRSTPLMLASAFAGKNVLLHSYSEAVKQQYRFFSYGDAMLIL
ncbi:MAG: tRNA preQ1(34) S-adenosylmethionine ribosyltransferase-isomerase QueA [Nitrospirota bacterium]|nr:MAG: tRNA preQ1(34) S-adenosylmethionine ribosyltransferase-isomerase QueA [Nitrospirota bacterium]